MSHPTLRSTGPTFDTSQCLCHICFAPLLFQRLERLLGVTGPNAAKKRAKLSRELEVEDGLGDEFGAFLSDLDRVSEV